MNRENSFQLRTFWQFQLVGWGCFYLVDLLGSIPDFLARRYSLVGETTPIFFMFLGSCMLRPICRWLFRISDSFVIFEARAAVASVLTGIVNAFATVVVLHGVLHLEWSSLLPVGMWTSYVLFMWCSLFFSIKQWQTSTMERERLLRAEGEVREARLLALRYQLNPHFLFNSLNAVSTLVLDGNSPAATRMLAQIGDLLRASLDSEVTPEVPLAREMAFTERYLAIEQTRLGERLHYKTSIPVETRNALVPSMLLQPLIENAVRYGVAPLVEGGWITVESAVLANRLQIVIANSGRRDSEEHASGHSGIGLGNTAERLKTLYGTDYRFSMEWPEGGGCRVTVELPIRQSVDREAIAACAP